MTHSPTPSTSSIPYSSSLTTTKHLPSLLLKQINHQQHLHLIPTSSTNSSNNSDNESNYSTPIIATTKDAEDSEEEEEEEVEEEDSEGSISSGFEGLLERVRSPSSTTVKIERKKKRRVISTSSLGILTGSAAETGEEAEEEGELIDKLEILIDPRDLLREQLRRNENRSSSSMTSTIGKGSGSRVRSSLAGMEDRVSEVSVATSIYTPRRYFILSTAGKLIFTTDEDEEAATTYVGVMQAIISIFADEGDKLRYVNAGTTKIAFMLKSPLYLVCVSDWGEPESVLRTHMEYLYLQVLSVVTFSQLQAIFLKRSNFDLRRLLEGTEPFFKNLTENLQISLPILTSSLEVYRMDSNLRDEVAKALAPASKIPELLYALIISLPTPILSNSSTTATASKQHPPRILTLLRPKSHSIHPTDLHLLLSTISSNKTFYTNTLTTASNIQVSKIGRREGEGETIENFIPICLPRFEKKGFLHAYISFISPSSSSSDSLPIPTTSTTSTILTSTSTTTSSTSPDLTTIEAKEQEEQVGKGIGIILIGSDRDSFEKMRECGKLVRDKLVAKGLLEKIEGFRGGQRYSLAELAIPGLRHFLYKSKKFVQVTFPEYEGDYIDQHNQYRLITLYQNLNESLSSRITTSGDNRPGTSLIYLRTEHESVMGWSTSNFELYLTVSPFLPKNKTVAVARSVCKWIKGEENRLFLVSAPSF